MINREKQIVSVVSFTSGKDEYGRIRQKGSTTRPVEMCVKVYQQTNTTDIRYVDVSKIGLTYDNDITDENQIIIDGETYQILYVIKSNRLNQILMKRV